jgi:hypothetical protein
MRFKPIQARAEEKRPTVVPLPEDQLGRPTLKTILKLIYNTVARLFHDPIGMILASAFFLIMVWGQHGKVELLGAVWSGWKGPGSDPSGRTQIISWIPWDQEWISFAIGAVLLILIPVILIKRVFKQDLRDYGLGPPRPGRWGLTLLSGFLLLVVSAPAFWLGAQNEGMRGTYPFFRGDFQGTGEFLIYQLGYLLFFIVIEFVFRGYLLFGLFNLRDTDVLPGVKGIRGPLVFGYYAIFISMLSYTAWHLGKPIPELWGTLVWGIAAGTLALACGTIWHIIAVHWLLNALLDWLIIQG